MSLYIIKIILGSGLLWLVYHFWLQNAKMFRFNRAYLILALLAAYLVPLMPLHSTAFDPGEVIVLHKQTEAQVAPTVAQGVDLASFFPAALYIAWSLISLVFLFRFGKNLLSIWQNVLRRRTEDIGEAKIVYLAEQEAPYSFGRYIFLPDADRERLDPVLLTHEMAHVEQRHSWDILFVELLVILSWFNPFVYLFKRSIRLNHEFLADEAVVDRHNNRQTYPYLILQRASGRPPMALSSAFHYSNLKKRLSMITKKQSLGQVRLKQFSVIPLLMAFLFVFAGEALAQIPPPPPPTKAKADIPPPPPPKQAEADQIPPPPPPRKADANRPPPPPPVHANFSFDKPGYRGTTVVIKDENGEKKALRFEDMTDDQKRQYLPPPPPKPAINNPSYSEYQSWRDASQYGVWLDGKRIANSELDNYKASDIAMYDVSKLAKNAKNFGKHTYQLTVWTERGYEKLLKEWYDKWGD